MHSSESFSHSQSARKPQAISEMEGVQDTNKNDNGTVETVVVADIPAADPTAENEASTAKAQEEPVVLATAVSAESNQNEPVVTAVVAEPAAAPSEGPGGPPPRVRRIKRVAAKSHLNTASHLRPSKSLPGMAETQKKRSLAKASPSGSSPAKKKKPVGRPAKNPKDKVKKEAVVKKTASGDKKTSGLKNGMVYEGPPNRKLAGGWPTGWIERTFARQTTTSARADSYFYPPGRDDHKLRSIKEVERYLEVWNKTKDAEKAWKARKGG